MRRPAAQSTLFIEDYDGDRGPATWRRSPEDLVGYAGSRSSDSPSEIREGEWGTAVTGAVTGYPGHLPVPGFGTTSGTGAFDHPGVTSATARRECGTWRRGLKRANPRQPVHREEAAVSMSVSSVVYQQLRPDRRPRRRSRPYPQIGSSIPRVAATVTAATSFSVSSVTTSPASNCRRRRWLIATCRR